MNGAVSGDGGDGGGGGGPTGLGGNSTFTGESNGQDGQPKIGGAGGFGGGGGGTNPDVDSDTGGGTGGFGGGGGAFADDDAGGGTGGFGGGGGGAAADDDANGGDGGFGGGGGAADDDAGSGGFGAGDGDTDDNGGGGMGAGGAVFVVSGKLTLANVAFNNNGTMRGTGADNNDGQSLGGAIFIYDHATNGAVNGKSNAEVVVSSGCGLPFSNSGAADNGTTGFVGDGTTLNNDDNVYGLINGALAGNGEACVTLISKVHTPPIPSLSFWGLIILAFLLMSISLVFLLNVNYETVLNN